MITHLQGKAFAAGSLHRVIREIRAISDSQPFDARSVPADRFTSLALRREVCLSLCATRLDAPFLRTHRPQRSPRDS